MLQFNVLSIIRRQRPGMRRKRIVLREITPTQVKVDQLNRVFQRLVSAWWVACRDRLLPAYRAALERTMARAAATITLDDAADDFLQLQQESTTVSLNLDTLLDQLLPELRLWADAYQAFHQGRWGAALQPTGVQLGTLLNAADVADTVEATVQANVSLIRSLNSEARTRVEGIIFRGFQQRLQAPQIAKQLSEGLGLSRARARRIAADQTAKLSAQLDQARMEQAGLEEFQWVHSGKLHFRPWHRARDGKVFKLRGEILPDDMPGIPILCGCKKRAVITLDEG